MENKFNEILEVLKQNVKTQTGYGLESILDNLSDELYNKYFKDVDYKRIAVLDIVKHRWYETAVFVYKIYDKYLGIKLVNSVFSEMSSYEDFCETPEFFEMEEFTTISYRKKNKGDK